MKDNSLALSQEQKEQFMRLALAEAKKAEAIKEVPIGAIVVLENQVIGTGYNYREHSQDATAHAELIAIQEACKNIENWRLEQAKLFVTLEPCPMCSGAMLLSRVSEVYYGASDPKGGTAGTLMNLLEDTRFNHVAYVERGILEEECSELLTNFFRNLRQEKKMIKNNQKD